MWGLSPQDNNAQINNYKTQYGVTNPCAGTEGGGPEAIDVVIAGQNFLGYPTYCIVCPDRTLYFDVCWPPTASCFDPYIESCVPPLAAGFSAEPLSGCQGISVNYYDQSAGNPTEWSWTFEGGDPATSTEQNPVVTYNDQGDWDVTLEVSDGTNFNTLEEEDFMAVFALPDVTLDPQDTACLNWPPYELSGGLPEGGSYSGPGVGNNFFDPSIAGVGTHAITYTYEDENGCVNSAEQELVVDICAGISNIERDGMLIYPNPSQGIFILKVDGAGPVNVSVFSVTGNLIYENDFAGSNNQNLKIDLSGQSNGLYIININYNDRHFVEKIRIVGR